MDSSYSSDEYEDEELLVYLDFQSKIKPESLQESNLKVKMIGFETDAPVVQINNKVFRGTFEHAMGTNVFFTEDSVPSTMDPNFEVIPSTIYKYHLQTDKVLKMERLFITPKKDYEECDANQNDEEDDMPDESYLDALNHFLAPGELPPRTLSGVEILKPSEFQTIFRQHFVDEDDEDDEKSEETVDEQTEESFEEQTVKAVKNQTAEAVVKLPGEDGDKNSGDDVEEQSEDDIKDRFSSIEIETETDDTDELKKPAIKLN